EGQSVCVDCGELVVPAPLNSLQPALTSLTATELWCPTCGETVGFHPLTQPDGTDGYLCNTCDTAVGQNGGMAPPASNGTHASTSGIPVHDTRNATTLHTPPASGTRGTSGRVAQPGSPGGAGDHRAENGEGDITQGLQAGDWVWLCAAH